MITYKVLGIDGKEYGPADLATVRVWVTEGRIGPHTKVQTAGTTDWKPASALPELGIPSPPPDPPQGTRPPGPLRRTPLAGSETSAPLARHRIRWAIYGLTAVSITLVLVAGAIISHSFSRRTVLNQQTRDNRVGALEPAQPPPFKGAQAPGPRATGDARKESSVAVQRYRKAAEQGDAEAQYQLGRLYAYGLGVARDSTEAAKWYRLAADQGHVSAQHWLGHLYAQGQGLETAHAEAPEPAASEPGKRIAGPRALWSDAAEAAKWWRKAADQGDAAAQFDLGWLYARGQGVETNHSEALRWYRKSAEQGNASAQHWLGHCYLSGTGTAKDEAEAFRWFRKAAEGGIIPAQNDVAHMYEDGRGVGKDLAEALRWYRKAADAGLPAAQNSFAWALATSTNAELRDGPLAVKYAEKAVKASRRANAGFLDTLAAAHAEAGDFTKAVAIQNEAIALLKQPGSKKDYASRLSLYEAKTPYREVKTQ
jgi:hypothetical protein